MAQKREKEEIELKVPMPIPTPPKLDPTSTSASSFVTDQAIRSVPGLQGRRPGGDRARESRGQTGQNPQNPDQPPPRPVRSSQIKRFDRRLDYKAAGREAIEQGIPCSACIKLEEYQTAKAALEAGAQRPSYPSSKPRKVDWEKLEAQEKEEKLDGDAALNKFFRDIYQDADEDTRRAMRKSFVESNGTVLSTNWNEVGSKMVEGSPPDDMEVKKWEY
ncbi:hypothetical protein RHGRI_016181 [Rhododendron griersonianum]|uniref:SGS domain-containing protein n=1 Tax=Rhododendron griersonianum TaxID=479676 RepID=A0AAV6JQ32_9ERIC|nr:hypothetical protein RHGRI_016181 [Rhododendron griersonianum]